MPHVAGSASDTKGIARRRTRTPEERRQGLRVVDTAEGTESRTRRAPAWSHQELGIGAAGLPKMPWLAIQYSIAGHCDDHGKLHRGLVAVELRLAEREKWPWQVQKRDGTRGYYATELAGLVLDADAHRPIFTAAPVLYAAYLDVTEEIWRVKMEPLYRSLSNEYEKWLAVGRAWVQRRINVDRDAPVASAVATA